MLVGEEGKKHYLLIKDVNISMHDHTLHCGRNHFCYYLQVFWTEKYQKVILKIALEFMIKK